MTSIAKEIKLGEVDSSKPTQVSTRDMAAQAGAAVRKFFSDHGVKLLMAFVFIAVVYVIVMSFSQMAESDAILANAGMLRSAIVSANSLRHNKCKRRGACGKSCPFISEQDPRVVICKHSDEIALILSECQRSKDELVREISKQKEHVKDGAVLTTLDTLVTQQEDAVRDIKEINAVIADLDAAAAKWDTLDAIAINSKERAVALVAAANAQSYKLSASGLNAIGLAFLDRIKALKDKPQTAKLSRYDSDAGLADTQTSVLTTQQQQILTRTSSAEYKNAVTTLLTESVDSGKITEAMAVVLNAHQELVSIMKNVVISFSRVSEYFGSTVGSLEDGFNNKNPGDELSADNQTAMISEGDYNSVMITTSLGKDLVKNHSKFSQQRASFDSGGGVPSLRDDDNDLNPWAGIFGRPSYFKANGESMDKSSEPLRQIPSDIPEDLKRVSAYQLINKMN
jgi:hypothetical protein